MTEELIQIQISVRNKKIIATSILIILLGSLLVLSVTLDSKNQLNATTTTNLPYYGQVSDFTLTNSNNQSYTFSQDQNKIRIVNFFYTKCPGDEGCSLVTLKLAQLFSNVRQKNYLDQVRFISIDFDYINDTVADLSEYARTYTADTVNWQFLIGNKTEIDNVTKEWGFYFEVNNGSGSLSLNHDQEEGEDPYNHSFVIYVVDQNSNIRKFLLGTSWDIEDAFNSIKLLLSNESAIPPA